jgi:hypothetical protein
MTTPVSFDGIAEKLKRSAENVRNLEAEIETFFKSGKYSVVPKNDIELIRKMIEYHQNRPMPLRFSVIAGEVIHHLRSCIDHIAWQFSDDAYRTAKSTQIEFPILEQRPIDKASRSRYERRVKGILDKRVLGLIENLQPYNAPDPIDSPLAIIHKMDIIDKHRELVLCIGTASVRVPMDTWNRFVSYQRGAAGSVPVDLAAEFERDPNFYPQIALRQFGSRGLYPLVQALTELQNFIVNNVVRAFEPLV